MQTYSEFQSGTDWYMGRRLWTEASYLKWSHQHTSREERRESLYYKNLGVLGLSHYFISSKPHDAPKLYAKAVGEDGSPEPVEGATADVLAGGINPQIL